MKNFFLDICSNFLMVSLMIYIWHDLLKIKINFKSIKLYIALLSVMLFSMLNYYNVNNFIKIILLSIFFIITFKLLFNESIQKSIIIPVFYQIIIMISEAIYVLMLLLIYNDNIDKLTNSYIGTFMTNVFIAIICFFIFKLKFIKKVINKILCVTDKIRYVHLIVLCAMIILIENFLLAGIYYKLQFKYLLIFNIALTLTFCIITYFSFKNKNNYNKVSNKYNIAINSLNDYEEMMSKYRVNSHENRNLLLTIRAMILNNEKDIPQYIDTIIQSNYNDDQKLLQKVSIIPSGGLRATIYSEILKIKSNKIKYILNISPEIKSFEIIELDSSTTIDMCKIIGVLIDNSIEAVKDLKKRNIEIDLFNESGNLCIKISNYYLNNIQFDKIFDKGYTTKGSGHGYGLSLVKKIISNNKKIEISTDVQKDVFSQTIKIQY